MASKRSRTIEDSSEEDISQDDNEESVDELEEESAVSEDEGRDEDEEDDEEEEEEDGECPFNVVDNEDEVAGEDEDEDEDDGDEGDADAVGEESTNAPRRMTARQRSKRDGTSANIGLIDLAEIEGTNRSKKVQLSAEEQRIKRAEMARRRRNLSQQRLEEEKKETLDKLLKKRAKKVRGGSEEDGNGESKTNKSRLHPPHPALLSWRSSSAGFTLSMTEDRAKRENLS